MVASRGKTVDWDTRSETFNFHTAHTVLKIKIFKKIHPVCTQRLPYMNHMVDYVMEIFKDFTSSI